MIYSIYCSFFHFNIWYILFYNLKLIQKLPSPLPPLASKKSHFYLSRFTSFFYLLPTLPLIPPTMKRSSDRWQKKMSEKSVFQDPRRRAACPRRELFLGAVDFFLCLLFSSDDLLLITEWFLHSAPHCSKIQREKGVFFSLTRRGPDDICRGASILPDLG